MPGKNKNMEYMDNVTTPKNITVDKLLKAYGLESVDCSQIKVHNKPCKTNPRCVCGIIEKQWLSENPPKPLSTISLRKAGEAVGLINHGNLCYANVFLQLWFHTKAFRQDVYECSVQQEEEGNPTFGTDLYTPKSKLGLLQLLFAEMEFGQAKTVDPIDFVEGLQLNKSAQQDAHEFYTLFVGSPVSLKNMVGRHFHGTLTYKTRCHQCRMESVTPSDFYNLALNLGDGEDIHAGLAKYLADERMEGDDQYACQTCLTKTDATKSTTLTKLPPSLILQIVRFEFSREKKKRLKFRGVVHIPEELDMTAYVDTTQSEHQHYKLRAVIVHLGSNCNQGHYIANIKDLKTKKWTSFSDDVVTKNEATLVEGKIAKAKEAPAGMIASNICYMLVYESTKQQDVNTSLPEQVEMMMQSRHRTFQEEITTALIKDEETKSQWLRNKLYMSELHPLLLPKKPKESDLISLEWLSMWGKNPDAVDFINHDNLLCKHGKLHFNKSNSVRCVSQELARHLYEQYKGGPRMKTAQSLCQECVFAVFSANKKKQAIDQDCKHLTKMMPSAQAKKKGHFVDFGTGFLVGKTSYRKWTKLARDAVDLELKTVMGSVSEVKQEEDSDSEEVELETSQLKNGSQQGQIKRGASELRDDDEEDMDCIETPNKIPHTNGLEPSTSHDVSMEDVEEQAAPPRPSSAQADSSFFANGTGVDEVTSFNEDLMCPHGNLTADKTKCKVVPDAVWAVFKKYFPDAVEFSHDTEPCQQCLEIVQERTGMQQENAGAAAQIRKSFQQLLRPQARYRNAKDRPPVLYLVSRDFVAELVRFVRTPQKFESPMSICNAGLLCCHGNVQVDVGLNGIYADQCGRDFDTEFVLVTPEEWLELSTRFSVDHVIQVITSHDQGDTTQPALCRSCLSERLEMQQYSYTDHPMIVRRAAEPTREPSPPVTAQGRSNRTSARSNTSSESSAACDAARSLRRRKQKGDLEILVTATDTLKEVKIKIAKELKTTMACDIHLSVDGRLLEEDMRTLRELNVEHDDIFYLREDRPLQEDDILQDDASCVDGDANSEQGFQGTLLGAD